jgi:hypothetical protein
MENEPKRPGWAPVWAGLTLLAALVLYPFCWAPWISMSRSDHVPDWLWESGDIAFKPLAWLCRHDLLPDVYSEHIDEAVAEKAAKNAAKTTDDR